MKNPNITIDTTILPEGYLTNGYNTEDGKCDSRYVGSYAIEIAESLATMKSEVFRRYYRKINQSARDSIDQKQKLVWKLVAHAYEAVAMGHAPEIFYAFMKLNAENITDNKSYNDFRDHMEAVFCYMN